MQTEAVTEVRVDATVIKERVHVILQRAHDALDQIEAEMLERIVLGIRVEGQIGTSYVVTMETED